MAQNMKKVELDVLELAWARKALETLRNVLVRGRTKEQTGGEIWAMRGREIDAVNALLNKFS